MLMRPKKIFKTKQRGAAAVEFAIVAGIGGFFLLLIGIMEIGRVLFYLNTASEVTRRGARLAVVCTPSQSTNTKIIAEMRKTLPVLPADKVSITYTPQQCNEESCRYATVAIDSGVIINTFIPFAPLSVQLPAFQTTLPRESLNNTYNLNACTL